MWQLVWSYLPIVVAPLAAITLALALQRWLKGARQRRAAATATTRGHATALVLATPPPKLTWDEVASTSNPLIAYVLPIFTSLSIILLGLWPFAYLGWVAIRLDPDPGWGVQVPPWFGNPGYFFVYGAAGLGIAFMGSILALLIGLGLHALGKCILWPEVCECAAMADREEGPAKNGEATAVPDNES